MPKMIDPPNPFRPAVDKVLPKWAADMVAPTTTEASIPYPGAVSVIDPTLAKDAGQALIQRLMDRGVAPELIDAVKALGQRAPRLLGHIQDITEVPGADFLGRQNTVPGNDRLSTIEINPDQSARGTMSTLHHEAAHAAQNLRGGRTLPGNPIGVRVSPGADLGQPFPQRYDLMNRLFGYGGNPYEQNANVAGVQGADRAMPNHPLTILRNQLRKLGLLD